MIQLQNFRYRGVGTIESSFFGENTQSYITPLIILCLIFSKKKEFMELAHDVSLTLAHNTNHILNSITA